MNNLIIEGFIGSGKGTIARATAKKMGLTVVDLDRRIADRLKMNTAEIYRKFGEPYYRAMETLILSEVANTKKRSVIVLGSGVAMMPQNREYLKKLGTVYYIKLSKSNILANMRSSKRHAWIGDEDVWEEGVGNIYKEREPAYRKTADVVIDAKGKSVDEIAEEIVADAKERYPES